MVCPRLESLEISGVKLGLENIRTLLRTLGNPQQSYPNILIAGTNGKGSVGAMLSEVLLGHGLRAGHYISPHLIDVRERIRINNEWIPTTEFETELGHIFSAIDRLLGSGELPQPPTYFETLTALAFQHFRKKAVHWAVVEVGLGGRFDATNVLNQSLSVITSLDYDHEAYLGETLAAIAGEKAGVLKSQGRLVSGIVPPEGSVVVAEIVERLSCHWRQVKPEYIAELRLDNGFPVFRYEPWGETIRVNLRGRHQAHNAATALLACDALQEFGFVPDRTKVQQALGRVRWPGRLELLAASPPVLIDCAHNPLGVRSLSAYLEDVGWNPVIGLFTAMQDKKYAAMLNVLSDKIETLFLTRVEPVQRCATLEQLSEAAVQAGLRCIFEENSIGAFERAKEEAQQKNLPLVIFGSIYLIGAILRHVGGGQEGRKDLVWTVDDRR